MQPLIEHSMELAGHRTRVLELEGRGPGIVLLHGWGDSADTWRPLLAELGRVRAARDRGRPPGLRPARRACAGRDPARSSTSSPPRSCASGARASRSWSPATRSAAASRCGSAEHADDSALAGVVPVAPAGLEMPGWFDLVERDPIIRELLDIPVPVPGALVRSLVGAPTASSRTPTRRPRSGRSSTRSRRTTGRASTRPRCWIGPAAAARAGDRAVRPRRRRLPGDARVGHARPDGPAHGRARRARRAARHARRADRGLRPLPAARGDERVARAAA